MNIFQFLVQEFITVYVNSLNILPNTISGPLIAAFFMKEVK